MEHLVDRAPGDACEGEAGAYENLLVRLLNQAFGEQVAGGRGKAVPRVTEKDGF